MKVRQNQYDLYMRVDTNTYGHRQWFYFSIKNKVKKIIKLNIYRFKKAYSLYQRGMRPYVRSLKSQEKDWHPAGYNLRYMRQKQTNDYGVKKGSSNYYLTFNYQFQHEEDQVFFAAGIPYEYSFLNERLLNFQEKGKKLNNIKVTKQDIGMSPCGLMIPIIKIQPAQANQLYCRHIITINCRSHPGEVSGSWVLDGLIDSLLSGDQISLDWMVQYNISLRILPMLNPDGVFFGNYRTGIVGDDFNRKFDSGRKDVFPQINCLKKMITQSKKQGQIMLFVDLHGHSILKNSFIYGPSEKDFTNSILRKLPFNLWHKSQYFKLSSCKFLTQNSKIQTARMYFQLKQNVLSYTCQNSLGLYGSTNGQTFQMTKQDWRKFGAGMLEAIKATIDNDKGKLVLLEDKQMKKQEDLRQTSTPPLQQSSRPLVNKRLQMSTKLKLKTQKFYQSPANNQSFELGSRIYQSTSKTITKGEKNSSNIRKRKLQSSFFSSKQSPKKQSSISCQQSKPSADKDGTKILQVRQRLPSLKSNEIKTNEVINGQLNLTQKNIRQQIAKTVEQPRNRTEQKLRKKLSIKQNNQVMASSQPFLQEENRVVHKLETFKQNEEKQKNDKAKFIQNIINDSHLKQARKYGSKNETKKQHFSLGTKLTPVIQNIKQKLFQVNSNTNKTGNRQSKIFCPLSSSLNQTHTLPSFVQIKNNQPIKKYSCDFIEEQSNDQRLDNIQISLKNHFQQKQRSITYDQSYLKSQIKKVKEMKETQREYFDDQEAKMQGWSGQNGQIQYDDNFSQNFDDSVNDSDSGDEDLPEQQKKHIFEYIRSHNCNRQRGRFFQGNANDQSDQEKEIEKKQVVQKTKGGLNKKGNINGFRQIVFKQGIEQQDQEVNGDNQINFNLRWGTNNSNIPKLRKNSHKVKQSSGPIKFKSFSTKIQPEQKDNQDEIYITHKKKLNQRNIRKQARKDPFVLVSRKQKYVTGARIYSNL